LKRNKITERSGKAGKREKEKDLDKKGD